MIEEGIDNLMTVLGVINIEGVVEEVYEITGSNVTTFELSHKDVNDLMSVDRVSKNVEEFALAFGIY
ncbi:hypothetical protein AGMMS49593_01770 [Endomicrobiia bacterium]|nr:hypothetical protein AGMMS49593_01770 [Endomicrobiia bacterium]